MTRRDRERRRRRAQFHVREQARKRDRAMEAARERASGRRSASAQVRAFDAAMREQGYVRERRMRFVLRVPRVPGERRSSRMPVVRWRLMEPEALYAARKAAR